MSDQARNAPGGAHNWLRNNVLGLVAIFLALNGTAVAVQVASQNTTKGERTARKAGKKGRRGPRGPAGPAGPQGIQGPATGPAGAALAGNYPNPTLNVSGGPCPNGQELVNVSALAALSCSAGVYSDGSGNVAAGPTSFPALTTGGGNSAVGESALVSNTSGNANSALGENALDSNTAGVLNTGVGEGALATNTTGALDTAVGASALVSNTTGTSNAALGYDALGSITTGAGNTGLGAGAGINVSTGNNNIDIDNAGVGIAESNTTRIGDSQTRAFMAGIRGVSTGVADAIPVLIDGSGQLGTMSSSREVKRDIQRLWNPRPLMKLKPVSFRYRSGPPELHYGLLAEQVAKVLPQLAVYGSDGLPETVQYQELPVLLLAKIQDQERQLKRQQAQIDWLMRNIGGR